MNALQKPQRVLRKFVSKVSIQTVVKHGDDEAREPLSSLRSREEWPLPRSVDLKDPKVSLLSSQAYLCFFLFFTCLILKMILTRAELACLEERPRLRLPARLDGRRQHSQDFVCHHEQCHSNSV
jgi:hypothetical protein